MVCERWRVPETRQHTEPYNTSGPRCNERSARRVWGAHALYSGGVHEHGAWTGQRRVLAPACIHAYVCMCWFKRPSQSPSCA